MQKIMENKVILVTGSGSGIGRSTAIAIAGEGGKVLVNDISEDGGRETANHIKQQGGEATFVRADVTKSTEVEKLIDACVQIYGRLDGAYNNAGIGHSTRKLHEIPEADWDRVIAINMKGVFLCMKYELMHMLRQGSGSIVNCASMVGLVGWREESVYTASKHGVIGLTRSAAAEYATKNIRINAVCPGIILTPMSQYQGNDPEEIKRMYAIPMERRGYPHEVAETVIWLLSDRSSYTTGHALVLDGGFSICLGPNTPL